MVEEFDLNPMAYVTTSHALSHFFLQNVAGIPTTAIFLELASYWKHFGKGGKGQWTTSREEDLLMKSRKLFLSSLRLEVFPKFWNTQPKALI